MNDDPTKRFTPFQLWDTLSQDEKREIGKRAEAAGKDLFEFLKEEGIKKGQEGGSGDRNMREEWFKTNQGTE